MLLRLPHAGDIVRVARTEFGVSIASRSDRPRVDLDGAIVTLARLSSSPHDDSPSRTTAPPSRTTSKDER